MQGPRRTYESSHDTGTFFCLLPHVFPRLFLDVRLFSLVMVTFVEARSEKVQLVRERIPRLPDYSSILHGV